MPVLKSNNRKHDFTSENNQPTVSLESILIDKAEKKEVLATVLV